MKRRRSNPKVSHTISKKGTNGVLNMEKESIQTLKCQWERRGQEVLGRVHTHTLE